MSKFVPIVQVRPGETIIARILGGPVLVWEHWLPREERFHVCTGSEMFDTIRKSECQHCPDADRRAKAYLGANVSRSGDEPFVGLLVLTELAYLGLRTETPAGFKLRLQRPAASECSKLNITVEERAWPVGMKRTICPDIVRVLWNIWGVLTPTEAPHVFDQDRGQPVPRADKPRMALGQPQKRR